MSELEQQKLKEWEKQQPKNAHQRALIMQILKANPQGLTVQQIQAKELDWYGYTFLTDNRLRELRAKGWVVNLVSEGKPMRWIAKGRL
jgi:hypothetical protein